MKSFFVFLALATASAQVSLSGFERSFELTSTGAGSCLQSVTGQIYRDALHIGSFYFPDLTRGKTVIDDELVRLESESIVTENKIVNRSTMITKNSGTVSIREASASLKGDRLRLTAKSISRSPGEPALVSYSDICNYRAK